MEYLEILARHTEGSEKENAIKPQHRHHWARQTTTNISGMQAEKTDGTLSVLNDLQTEFPINTNESADSTIPLERTDRNLSISDSSMTKRTKQEVYDHREEKPDSKATQPIISSKNIPRVESQAKYHHQNNKGELFPTEPMHDNKQWPKETNLTSISTRSADQHGDTIPLSESLNEQTILLHEESRAVSKSKDKTEPSSFERGHDYQPNKSIDNSQRSKETISRTGTLLDSQKATTNEEPKQWMPEKLLPKYPVISRVLPYLTRAPKEKPRLVIGRLTVEVVNVPRKELQKTMGEKSTTLTKTENSQMQTIPSRLRFGLGQM